MINLFGKMKLVSAFAILIILGAALSDKNDEIQLKMDSIAADKKNELLQSVKSNATTDDVFNSIDKLQRKFGLLFNLTQEQNKVRFKMAAQNHALHQKVEDQDKTNTALNQKVGEQNNTIGALHQEVGELKETIAALLLKTEKEKNKTSATVNEVFDRIDDLQEHFDSIVDAALIGNEHVSQPALAKNCWDIYNQGNKNSGVYTIYFTDYAQESIRVYCDMQADTGGPGWTLFQRRQDGSVSFNQSWDSYSEGFGNLYGEFWLGNKKLAQITRSNLTYQLRIELWDWDNQHRWAQYSSFRIMDESEKFKIELGSYSGDAGDSLTFNNNNLFSTPDVDNDSRSSANCAQKYWAGWWYVSCGYFGLNNAYHSSSRASKYQGIAWYHWHGWSYSLKKVQMKIRPVLL